MPASTIPGGVSKSGSPTPRLITSSIVARMSKKRRMPDGGTVRTRSARARSANGARASVGGGGVSVAIAASIRTRARTRSGAGPTA